MYQVVKLAALSAALAAALVTVLDAHRPAPDAGKFLADRIQTRVEPVRASGRTTGGALIVPDRDGCTARGWPYREDCRPSQEDGKARPVRLIGLDAVGTVAGVRSLAQVAQR